MIIELSDRATYELLRLQAIESGRVGNFDTVEPAIDRLRYRIFDIVMTEAMQQLEKVQKS